MFCAKALAPKHAHHETAANITTENRTNRDMFGLPGIFHESLYHVPVADNLRGAAATATAGSAM
jgi:hypothetical protein